MFRTGETVECNITVLSNCKKIDVKDLAGQMKAFLKQLQAMASKRGIDITKEVHCKN